MKVTYKDIPGLVRCPFQFQANVCFPGCGCTGEKSCWVSVTKEVTESELKDLIDSCKHIVKVEQQ